LIKCNEKLKLLVQDLKAYNTVFMPEYERFIEQIAGKIRTRIREVSGLGNYVREIRNKNIKY
jgi:hypothetical protein